MPWGKYFKKQQRIIQQEQQEAARFRPSILTRLIGQPATVRATQQHGVIRAFHPETGMIDLEIDGNVETFRGVDLELPL
jgi:hypothetical protein